MCVCVLESLRENGGSLIEVIEEDELLEVFNLWSKCGQYHVNVSKLIKPLGQRKSKLVNKIRLGCPVFARVMHGGHAAASRS